MRLHEYLKGLTPEQRLRFQQWQILNNRRIYQLKKTFITEKRNAEQQHRFENSIVELHQLYQRLEIK